MNDSLRYHLPLKHIDGLLYPDYFVDENVREAIKWKPNDEDVIVATYPKCGTTWVQAMVWSIQHFGEWPMPRFNDMMIKLNPFIECIGPAAAEALKPPRHLKSHLPFDYVPYNPKTKYITIVRNPLDVCVSYFHFCRQLFEINDVKACTFDEFFEEFIRGEVPYGDFFDHILSWHKHKNDSNVLFLVYEDVMKHHKETALKMAKFLSNEKINYEELMLANDSQLLSKIVKNTTFDSMKDMPVNNPSEFTDPKNIGEGGKLIQFYRKGRVGDWITYFNENQIKRITTKMNEKLPSLITEFGWSDLT